jgi:hypothetical protein
LLLNSKEKALEFTVKIMKMDRDTGLKTYNLMAPAWASAGISTRAGLRD